MIVPMKKVSLVVMDKDKKNALEAIRALGLIHLEQKNVSSEALGRLLERKALIDEAESVLRAFGKAAASKTAAAPKGKIAARDNGQNGKPQDFVELVTKLAEKRKSLQDAGFAAAREAARFEKWGSFNPADFKFLVENGVEVGLYDITFSSFETNAKDVPYIVLGQDKKNNSVRLLAFGKIPNEHPYPLPEKPPAELEAEALSRKSEIAALEKELTALAPRIDEVLKEKAQNAADIEFAAADAGMDSLAGSTDNMPLSVSWITGYAPASDTGILKRAACENNWAFYAEDPAEDDLAVPTKLKNNKLTSLIYPLTDFLEMSPGYREIDISGWFLLFFTLFFGMIFGDAAYGAILIIASLIGIAKTAKKGVPPFLKFLLLMSASNFVWGALSGSWFGLDIALIPNVLQNLSLPLIAGTSTAEGWLASYNAGNFWIRSGIIAASGSLAEQTARVNSNLMVFCFSIALVQLCIAHIKGFIRSIKSPRCIAELGQLGMLTGMYFVVLSLVVFNTGFAGVKAWQLWALAGGFALSFIFANYEGSLVKSVLSSVSNIISVVLGITNVFSDIMSYIRLWAVGLAGASIASTVDAFAGPMLGHFIFFIFGAALFLFGHGFNMVLNVLSVLVHGVRLNTLEFSSHAGLTWAGSAYKPFAKRVI